MRERGGETEIRVETERGLRFVSRGEVIYKDIVLYSIKNLQYIVLIN